MDLRVERDALTDAVVWAARSLSSRPLSPVLNGLLLEADDEGLSIAGFDYEVSTRVVVDAVVAEAGRVVVPGKLVAEIVRSLPPQPVELRVDGSRLVLTCGSARFTLPLLEVEEYPALPPMPQVAGTVNGAVLAAAVAQVAVAAGREDTLPALTGIRMELTDDSVTFVATDRYRLAVRTMPWSGGDGSGGPVSLSALVPARSLADAAKSLAGQDEVTLRLSPSGSGLGGEGLFGVEGGRRRTTSRLLDHEFPAYRQLLPSEATATADVDSAQLADVVKRVALVNERNTPLRLTFDGVGEGGRLTLEAGSNDTAQAREALGCRWTGPSDSEPFVIAFNPQYLLDGLAALGAETTRLSFTGPTRPAVLTPGGAAAEDGGVGGGVGGGMGGGAEGDGTPAFRYLLMPMRLQG